MADAAEAKRGGFNANRRELILPPPKHGTRFE